MVAKNSIFKKEFTKKIDIKQLQEFQTRFKSGKSHIQSFSMIFYRQPYIITIGNVSKSLSNQNFIKNFIIYDMFCMYYHDDSLVHTIFVFLMMIFLKAWFKIFFFCYSSAVVRHSIPTNNFLRCFLNFSLFCPNTTRKKQKKKRRKAKKTTYDTKTYNLCCSNYYV